MVGGRWKPLHYFYRRSLLADVMAACGAAGANNCYVKNDAAGAPLGGAVHTHAHAHAHAHAMHAPHTRHARAMHAPCVCTGERFDGHVLVRALAFADGAVRTLARVDVALAEGAGTSARFTLDLSGINATTHLLLISCHAAAAPHVPLSHNEELLAPPSALRLPAATVVAAVAERANLDGTLNVTLRASATALYVSLTTRAHGPPPATPTRTDAAPPACVR